LDYIFLDKLNSDDVYADNEIAQSANKVFYVLHSNKLQLFVRLVLHKSSGDSNTSASKF